MVLMVLEVILVVLGVVLVVLGVVLVVLHGAQRQCSEQMFGTDSVRNNVPSTTSRTSPDDLEEEHEDDGLDGEDGGEGELCGTRARANRRP